MHDFSVMLVFMIPKAFCRLRERVRTGDTAFHSYRPVRFGAPEVNDWVLFFVKNSRFSCLISVGLALMEMDWNDGRFHVFRFRPVRLAT